MNKPIRTISIFCLGLFLALMVNATYLQFWAAGDYNDDPRNRRIIEAAFSRERGAILVGRDPIAESVPSDDEFQFQRSYPSPLRYANLTGFFSFYTQTGLEQSQNPVLSGEDPRLFVTRLVDLLSNETNQGGNVELTIDAAAQDAAFEGLEALPGRVEGSVVALEPTTGKILAMASLPSYDPNRLASHDLQSVGDAYDELLADDSEPLINRAVNKRLPPGSTFKLVTAAAAIEELDLQADDDVPAGEFYQLPQTTGESGAIGNDGRSACSPSQVPFTVAMANSCNTTFARLAVDVGAEGMLDQAEAFGFNSDVFDDLSPAATSVYPEDPNEPQVGQTGIGQFEVSATPLQMAMVAAGIANDGTVMRPYLVNKVQSADDQDLEQTDPRELSRAVSSSTAGELTDLLVATVEQGTASAAAIPGVQVAAKTGTAQSGVEDVPPYAWFVSFAPADDPQVAVAVMIESADIERSEIAGGTFGGPIARSVMEAVIQ